MVLLEILFFWYVILCYWVSPDTIIAQEVICTMNCSNFLWTDENILEVESLLQKDTSSSQLVQYTSMFHDNEAAPTTNLSQHAKKDTQ